MRDVIYGWPFMQMEVITYFFFSSDNFRDASTPSSTQTAGHKITLQSWSKRLRDSSEPKNPSKRDFYRKISKWSPGNHLLIDLRIKNSIRVYENSFLLHFFFFNSISTQISIPFSLNSYRFLLHFYSISTSFLLSLSLFSSFLLHSNPNLIYLLLSITMRTKLAHNRPIFSGIKFEILVKKFSSRRWRHQFLHFRAKSFRNLERCTRNEAQKLPQRE